MAHKHSVYDTDTHFIINPVTRVIKNEGTKKTMLMQHDHNSERFSFELPRYIENHDMMLCDMVEIHYINIDSATKEQFADVYYVNDMEISKDDANSIVFTWLISENATRHAGSLSFLIRFACTSNSTLGVMELGDTLGASIEYAWHTAINSDISISGGFTNAEAVTEPYPDILAQWKSELFEAGGDAAVNVTSAKAEALAAVKAESATQLAAIQKAGENISNAAAIAEQNAKNVLANAITGNLKGEIVTADDVSPIQHEMAVNVYSKNLFNFADYQQNAQSEYMYKIPRLIIGKVYTIYSETPMTWVKISNNTSGYVSVQWLATAEQPSCNSFTFTMTRHPNIPESNTQYICFKLGGDNPATPEEVEAAKICIVEGETATEYTPYIEPSSIAVTRCGKNIAYQNDFSIAGTAFSSGSIGSFHGTVLVKDIKIVKGASYIISMDKPEEVSTPRYFLYNGKLSAVTHTAAYNEIVPNDRGVEKTVASGVIVPTGEYEYIAITTGGASTFTNGELAFEIKNLQLELGDVATDYEPYNGVTLTPSADGTVEGMTSLSPNMTILTDTADAVIECTYNRDTNKVINSLVEALAALNSGANT